MLQRGSVWQQPQPVSASFGSSLSIWFAKLASFLQNALGQVLQGRLSDKEKETRAITYSEQSGTFLGISKRELGVIAVGAVIIGVLFLFAARIPVSLETLAIYIIMGGVALGSPRDRPLVPEQEISCYNRGAALGSRDRHHGPDRMALRLGLCPANPDARLHREPRSTRQSLGLIMLSGPALSLIIALACLCMIPFGGIWKTAGTIGFSINLLTAVFEMLPISPCDGKVVYAWDRLVWGVVAVPLMLLYFVVNL